MSAIGSAGRRRRRRPLSNFCFRIGESLRNFALSEPETRAARFPIYRAGGPQLLISFALIKNWFILNFPRRIEAAEGYRFSRQRHVVFHVRWNLFPATRVRLRASPSLSLSLSLSCSKLANNVTRSVKPILTRADDSKKYQDSPQLCSIRP